ncbi:iron-containing redox enzyme family protein [Vibrio ruber]|uniref:iron-containing redox enzyme family protein n=1 Tax=Vibrio ruber TaxID=184755 RepID=UPI00289307CF|nr:iron-containing redox enzyme family protein [Vibrio ruber]WNJ96290.1 iron-containing redox enzyme family protein [Vibrio ruber]
MNEINNQGKSIISTIKEMIEESGINHNDFYKTFQQEPLPLNKVKEIFQQYYYYIRTFPQILSGLAPRVEDELIRLKISRTVVSELGDGHGDPHYIMFEKSLSAIGVTLDDYKEASYIPEAESLVSNLERLFLKESPNYAIGAHYVIEEFGYPMIVNLYEGFRLYDSWEHEDFNYFYLHILIECNHVDWIQDALISAATDEQAKDELLSGAAQVLEVLMNFWNGLNRLAHQ